MAEAKKTKKEIVSQAYPKGKKIRLNDRVEVEFIVDKNGHNKGDKVKMHPTTAEHFKIQNWVK